MPKITSAAALGAIADRNALYLRHLRGTGNASLAARFAGKCRETFAGRRRADPRFDAECGAALAFACAALASKGGAKPVPASEAGNGLVAAEDEYMADPNLNNELQVRRARPGHITARGEEAFLEALAATANIQLSAETIGVDARAFYKRGATSHDFARRMQDALAAGYEAVEFALVGTALRTLAPDGRADADPDGGGPVTPHARMSIDQALAAVEKAIAAAERRKAKEAGEG